MPATDVDYCRSIEDFEKEIIKNRWRVDHLPDWYPGVKDKPIMLSDGDSWFDFPVKSLTDVAGVLLRYTVGLQNFGMDSKTNVMDYVARDETFDGIFLRMERSGDHAQELAAQQPDQLNGVWEDKFPSQTLYTALQNDTIRSQVDGILLSAGGNDMVCAARHGGLLQYTGDWRTSFNDDVLQQAAQEVVSYYLKALQYRDEFAPQAVVVCHSYAYPVQVYRGTTVEFEFTEIGGVLQAMLNFTRLEWLKTPLAAIGVNVDELGDYQFSGDANLHETMDRLSWPANPEHPQREGVHPERAQFIRHLLDVLYHQMQRLPERYAAETGKALSGYEYIDIRHLVQEPHYWSDFIHLNSAGYQVVGDNFVRQLKRIFQTPA